MFSLKLKSWLFPDRLTVREQHRLRSQNPRRYQGIVKRHPELALNSIRPKRLPHSGPPVVEGRKEFNRLAGYTFISRHTDKRKRDVEVWGCGCGQIVHNSDEVCGVRLIVPERGAAIVMFDTGLDLGEKNHNSWLDEYSNDREWEAYSWLRVGEMLMVYLNVFEKTHTVSDLNLVDEMNGTPEFIGAVTHLHGPQSWTTELMDSTVRSLVLLRGDPLAVLVHVEKECADRPNMTIEESWQLCKDELFAHPVQLTVDAVVERLLEGQGKAVNWGEVFPGRTESTWWGFETWPIRASLIEQGAISDQELFMVALGTGDTRVKDALLNGPNVPNRIRVLTVL